jgi:lysyl-tRNA synthetase class 2
MCAERGWRFALLGASDRLLDTYRSLGLRPLYHGDEAVIDIASFSLAGGAMKSVRQAVNRVDRYGYHVEIHSAGSLEASVRQELEELEATWLKGGKRKGFVMELDELFRLDGDDAIFVIGRHPSGSLVGFLEIAVCPASSSLSLSTMPREAGAPNGFNAFLIDAAVNWARANEFASLSLNFSPAARLLNRDANSSGWRRIARLALRVLKRILGLQLDNLLVFNRHFSPRWQPRFIVIDRLIDLPRVIVAAMAAERYLPFAEFLRGRDESSVAIRRQPDRISASTGAPPS